ncbi:NADPH dehydrogenase NamA [Guptibacillus hwajinpoensis]|uniref:NADPH dehydrogenase NamA n=1 Tax=Guptibacillus hwajinpoensis TaxID=208199 RepID=UPI001CFC6DCB|nr:NADPH dehydrogenase NamA [Pseudalkalibacillus hwajinpoensis]WLR60427.1 NADPH dehydrogenase NamA [Pseudalkalibacillus hwajinpoensis]
MSSALFTPYTIKNVTFPNRIVMSPMCMYSCQAQDGKATNFHYIHYTSRAVGGTGLIFTEAAAVTEQGRISPQDLGIWSDDHIEGLKKIVHLSQEQGSKVGIQLAHAGRKAVLEGPIIAPSSIPFNDEMKTPEEMTVEQIKETIVAFRKGAERAKEAGFDVIELHGAHGYLINEFLSPLTNKRKDEYGGSKENRYRFLKETINEVNKVWDGPLFVRISAEEYHEEGNTMEDFVYFSDEMKKQGVDLVDCSTGGVVPARIKAYPGYQVKHAEQIRRESNIATGAVGLITHPLQAEEIIQNERADLVLLAREMLRDPYWARTAAAELGGDLKAPKQYERGWN